MEMLAISCADDDKHSGVWSAYRAGGIVASRSIYPAPGVDDSHVVKAAGYRELANGLHRSTFISRKCYASDSSLSSYREVTEQWFVIQPTNLQVGSRYGLTLSQYLCLTPFHSSAESRSGTWMSSHSVSNPASYRSISTIWH